MIMRLTKVTLFS